MAGSKSKSIIVSFQGDPSEKPKWLQLWCSAVEAANLDPALAEFRHESLADKFNNEYSEKVRLRARVRVRVSVSVSVSVSVRVRVRVRPNPHPNSEKEAIVSSRLKKSNSVLTPRR